MVGPVRSSPVGAIGAVARRDSSGGSRTGGALRSIAGRVADRMAREFRLFGDERRGGSGGGGGGDAFREGEDIYEIRGAARDLARDLNGKPTDEGRLARSLGLFAQESASLMAARPDAASLEAIARVIAARDASSAPETLDRAIGQIDQTTRDLAEDRLS